MNPTVTPPNRHPAGDGPPDDLDRLLRAFFRREVPTPWPRWKAPAAASLARVRGPLTTSRLALAASVAALLAGGWLLGPRLPTPPAPDSLQDGAATVPPELRRAADHPAPPARPR
jgi:hypothetical protein